MSVGILYITYYEGLELKINQAKRYVTLIAWNLQNKVRFWLFPSLKYDVGNYYGNAIFMTQWNDPVDFHIFRSLTPVPEPFTFLLLGGGLAGLAFYAHRRRKE